MLISEAYKEVQKELHKGKRYGNSGYRSAKMVRALGNKDILDYGCGNRSLETALGFNIHNYDPCIEEFEHNNTPHQVVYCGDVLEHIEPELLDNVLADIKRCTLTAGLLVIATRKAKKRLPDGRNAHLTIENADWWREKISQFFTIKEEFVGDQEYIVWV